MDATQLFIGLIMSVVGYGYFTYGKRRPAPVFLVSGIILMGVGYIPMDAWLSGIITFFLIVGPFFIR